MQSPMPLVVILGTGGTIAGTASTPTDTTGYRAGAAAASTRSIAGVPALAEHRARERAGRRSSTARTWTSPPGTALARRVAHHLARAEVAGVVVTHGTDTLEETAYFLQRVLAPAKPVVLTARCGRRHRAEADGPRNLPTRSSSPRRRARAASSSCSPAQVHAARDVRKAHPHRLDAFARAKPGRSARSSTGAFEPLREAGRRPSAAVRPRALPEDASRVAVGRDRHQHGRRRRPRGRRAGRRGRRRHRRRRHRQRHAPPAPRAPPCARRARAACRRAAQHALPRRRDRRSAQRAIAFPSAGALTPVQARVELILSCSLRARPARLARSAQTTSSATSMLPRVAFEYGHTWCAASTSFCAASLSMPGILHVQRDLDAEAVAGSGRCRRRR